ncbi:MAG: hypothetical protein KGL39_27830 [Patescibacteria group bacterium]|nr:hypothetical protein [Patescibacteria group bacterium]
MIATALAPGQEFFGTAFTQSSTGPQDADQLPTAYVVHNGAVDSSVTVTVAKITTGVYALSGSVPSGYATGDFMTVVFSSIVAGFPTLVPIVEAIIKTSYAIDMSQAVPTSNPDQTVGDALNAARAQGFGPWTISGNSLIIYAADGTTAVRTFQLTPNGSSPTGRQ